jgi:hypothetical protein
MIINDIASAHLQRYTFVYREGRDMWGKYTVAFSVERGLLYHA